MTSGAGGVDKQRVAVGLRAEHGFRADGAGRAGPMLDDERLLPLSRASFSATMRGMASAAPPGGNGTMMRTGFAGQSCALHFSHEERNR